jgi:osmotically-inducible protein OsmY
MLLNSVTSQGAYLQADTDSGQYGVEIPTIGQNQDVQTESPEDSDLFHAIKSALHRNVFIKEDNIEVNVDRGWVYLEGTVESEEQRNLAQKTICDIFGVARVTNYLTFPRHKHT